MYIINKQLEDISEADLQSLINEEGDEILVTPEKFIRDIVCSDVNRIMEDIKEENYEFLGNYKNFSRVNKELNKIHEKNREEEKERS